MSFTGSLIWSVCSLDDIDLIPKNCFVLRSVLFIVGRILTLPQLFSLYSAAHFTPQSLLHWNNVKMRCSIASLECKSRNLDGGGVRRRRMRRRRREGRREVDNSSEDLGLWKQILFFLSFYAPTPLSLSIVCSSEKGCGRNVGMSEGNGERRGEERKVGMLSPLQEKMREKNPFTTVYSPSFCFCFFSLTLTLK